MAMRRTLIALGVAASLAFAAPVSAQTGPYGSPGNPVISNPTPALGSTIVVRGTGYRPFVPVQMVLTIQGLGAAVANGTVLATGTSDANGNVELSVVLPDSVAPGGAVFSLVGTGANGSELAQSVNLNVNGAAQVPGTTVPGAATPAPSQPSSGTLPFTGGESLPIAQVGGALLLAGAGAVVVSRRRSTAA
jgi:LPXTG-motif cell wall-anchored protein